ncbi:protein kinase [Lentisphaera marina]|uniref:serine/threonine-protein kinase n=1 Tax=Lentisphaera marina TaxID=1111041 RepID=UPI00236560A8|nr:serine/threonine-protein kinase [Lentisphaera marina]MDD7985331.1 protein kinase [Lentisphaera marina]
MSLDDKKFTDFLQKQYKLVQEKLAQEKIEAEKPASYHDRYINKTLIGEGAQKQIFQVYDTACSRDIAMAVLKGNSQVEKAQFLREARITALLQHPNIMPVYETGKDECQHPYFTMKLGRGDTLQELIDAKTKQPLQELLSLFLKVCEALIYAHSKGILHRDLKPENIYVGQFGEVLLCDWGLANIVLEDCEETILDDQDLQDLNLKVSLKGIIKGTPGFIAPEILKTADYSFQSDVYALGAIFYCLLTGQEPKTTDTQEQSLFSKQDNSESDSLKAICKKALEPNKEARYQTVREMSLDIRAYLNGFAPKAEDAGTLTQIKLLYKRNKRVMNTAAFFLILITALGLGFIYSLQQNEKQALKLLSQLKESDLKRKNAESELIPHYLQKAKTAFLEGQAETALTLAQVCFDYDKENKKVRDLLGKALMSMQNFEEAVKILKGINPEIYSIAKNCVQIKARKSAKPEQTIALLKTVGVKPENDKAYIYRNILYQEFAKSEPQDKLRLLRSVLMMRNNLTSMNSVLEFKDDAYTIDLSNNPDLEILNVLAKFGPAVVKNFDLSHTKIKSLYPIKNFNIINLHLAHTGKLPLTHFSHYYEYLDAEGSKNDFSPFLKNKPVQYLNIHQTPFSSYKVLTTLKKLNTLIVTKGKLPDSVRVKLPPNCKIIEK